MRHGLHVFHVIGQEEELAESDQSEDFHGGFLSTDEFGLDFLETDVASDSDGVAHECASEAQAAEFRMNQHADAADVTLPTTKLLMKSGSGYDSPFGDGQEGKIAAQVDILAPLVNDFGFGNAMLDEHPLVGWNGEEKFVETSFITRFKRPHFATEPALHLDALWVLVQYEFESHKATGP